MTFKRAAIWVVIVLLTVVFAYTGASKLAGRSAQGWEKRFERWGYPSSAAPAVGVIEVVAALALLIPRARRAAAVTILVVMAGAFVTHLVHGEPLRLIPPTVLGAFALVVTLSGLPRRVSESAAQSR